MYKNLSNIPLFNGIEENNIEDMLKCLGSFEKKYKKGQTIFSEGETIDCIGIVLKGMVVIEHSDVWGNNSIIGNADVGSIFGEVYASTNKPLLICVSATQDSTILFINLSRLLSTCNNSCKFHSTLIRNLLNICAYKNLQLSQKIINTTSKSIRGRLLSYFSECIKKYDSYYFEIPYNRQQLADYLNVDRSAMCNELSKMQKDGILEYDKNYFKLNKNI